MLGRGDYLIFYLATLQNAWATSSRGFSRCRRPFESPVCLTHIFLLFKQFHLRKWSIITNSVHMCEGSVCAKRHYLNVQHNRSSPHELKIQRVLAGEEDQGESKVWGLLIPQDSLFPHWLGIWDLVIASVMSLYNFTLQGPVMGFGFTRAFQQGEGKQQERITSGNASPESSKSEILCCHLSLARPEVYTKEKAKKIGHWPCISQTQETLVWAHRVSLFPDFPHCFLTGSQSTISQSPTNRMLRIRVKKAKKRKNWGLREQVQLGNPGSLPGGATILFWVMKNREFEHVEIGEKEGTGELGKEDEAKNRGGAPRAHKESGGQDDCRPCWGLRLQTRSPKKSEVCIILRCSEKRSDPLIYLFFSFPSPEHIFLCWRLIYNSGNLLQREQVFLWDEAPWEAECTHWKKACHSTARQREAWVEARADRRH